MKYTAVFSFTRALLGGYFPTCLVSYFEKPVSIEYGSYLILFLFLHQNIYYGTY